ncbi:MAG: DNA polymerase, partial [Pseudomonadota bacterium]
MKTLLLVDGSSYLYRAFHALPDLRNARGEPTGAIYGVLNMLRRLAADYKPDYLACIFDAKGRTFRDDWYAEYKAHRPPMPPDLVQQIEPLHQAVAALGWPLLMIDGVEADDVIGTLARQAAEAGMRCVVSTGDKDLAQLVSPSVTLINTMNNERLDEAGVETKFGVPPRLMLDYLTLVGDAVDNVPGVEKVGPKTALKWLAQYGSLDGVIAHAQEIGGVVGENLRRALLWLPQAKKLLTVYCDVPLPVKAEELLPQPQGEAELSGLFQRFGFKSWLKDAAPAAAAAAEPAPPPQAVPDTIVRSYDTILDEEQLAAWLKRIDAAELTAFDTETTGLDPLTARLVGMSFCVEPGRAAYLPLAHDYAGAPQQLGVARALALLRPWLEDESKPKLGQNLKYDQHVLANHGVRLRGVVHDTLLESYVLESHLRHDMGTLAERHLHLETISYDDVTGKGAQRIGFEQVSVERATEYSAEDADVTLRLHQCLYPKVQAEPGLDYVYRQIELPAREVLFRMERTGVLIDAALLEAQSRELGQKMMELEHKAYREAGQPFNLNSPKQIGEIFFERLQLPVLKKTPSGAPSTDEEVLERLAAD